MRYSSLIRICVGIVVVAWAQACADSTSSTRDAHSGNHADTDSGIRYVRAPKDLPHPDIRLLSYEGSLCPEGTLQFDPAYDVGAFTLASSAEPTDKQDCMVRLALTMPPGYRLRKPAFIAKGWAMRDDESVRSSNINLTYAMSDRRILSHHTVWGVTSENPGSGFFWLIDTPRLTVRECSDPTEPIESELEIHIEMDVPQGTLLAVDLIEGRFEHGVEWTTCATGFPDD